MEFQSLQDKQNNSAFSKKIRRGPDLPGLGRPDANPAQICRRRAGGANSNGLPAGPGYQRPRVTETVSGEHGHLI
jgi:hypothetical protein